MERDRYSRGSMSSTRSHTRNQVPPQWNKLFCFNGSTFFCCQSCHNKGNLPVKVLRWLLLANAAIHSGFNSPFSGLIFKFEKNRPRSQTTKSTVKQIQNLMKNVTTITYHTVAFFTKLKINSTNYLIKSRVSLTD